MKLQDQLNRAFPDGKISVTRLCGTGCMADVVEVQVNGEIDGVPRGRKCVAKIANPEQKQLTEEDFKLFAGLDEMMKVPLRILDKFNKSGADELRSTVSKITDMARNEDFVRSVREGFDMRVEHRNSRTGAEVLARVGRRLFFAPQMYAVSRDGDVLLMELVEGHLLEQLCTVLEPHSTAPPRPRVPPEFVSEFVGIFIRSLLEGYLHQDLHPGNIILTSQQTYALLDWGETVQVPEMHRDDTALLIRSVVAGQWMGDEQDSFRELFHRMGVTLKDGRDDDNSAYNDLAKMLIGAIPVDPTCFVLPGWLEAWQKATNAFGISLNAAGSSLDTVGNEMRAVLGLPTS